MKEPFKITIQSYDQKVSKEKDHSDILLPEVIEMMIDVIEAAGYSRKDLIEELKVC